MKIRKAKKEDYEQIYKITRFYPRIIVQPLPKCRKHYVAIENKRIVGCCALEIYSPKIAEIRSVAVLPGLKKGYGKKLVKKCIKEAKKKKIKEIFIVTSIPEYFKKLGFNFYQKEKYILFKR